MSLRGKPDLVSKLREVIAKWPHDAHHHTESCYGARITESGEKDCYMSCELVAGHWATQCRRCQLESLLGREGQTAQEALCGIAGSATISTNEAGRRTAMDVSPSEELLSLPHRIVSHRIVSHEQMESVLNASEPNVIVNPDGSCSPSTPIQPEPSRSVQRREALQKGEPMPTFEPSTPIVPGTAGLSAAKVQSWANNCAVYERQHAAIGDFAGVEYHRGAKEAFQRVADALLSAAKPAEPEPIYTHFDPQIHVVTVIPASVEARIRKSVLEEAAQSVQKAIDIWKTWDTDDGFQAIETALGIMTRIRALAERPAPAGEARISRWQCPHCAHVNLMISANCENCKIPLVNTTW